MIKAIIIDDEQNARILLKKMISEFCTGVEIIADCEDLPNGVKAIRKHKPDLILLDIEMPGHSGLELLDFFNEEEISFSIIFTTAYNNYAIQAFKLSAIDYLLKPIEPLELKDAIERIEKKMNATKIDYSILKQNLNLNLSTKIAVPVGNSIKFIETEKIVFLKADSSYCEIIFVDKTKLVVSRTLKNFEDVLPINIFLRCHKSYIVNINFVVEFVKSDGGYLVLSTGANISISPEKVNELLEMTKMINR